MQGRTTQLSPVSRYYVRKLLQQNLGALPKDLVSADPQNPTGVDVDQALDRLLSHGNDPTARIAELECLAQLHQGLSTQGNRYRNDVIELESKVLSLLGIPQQSVADSAAPAVKQPDPPAQKGQPLPQSAAPVESPPGQPAALTLEAGLAVCNQLSTFCKKYLGGSMVVNHWQATRPDRPWLNQCQISRSGEFTHPEQGSQILTPEQGQDLQQWINQFIADCSRVIRNLTQMLKQAGVESNLPEVPTSPQPVAQSAAVAGDPAVEALRRAICQGELRAFYQPIVLVESLQILGFEALIRWQHPERGLLTPNQFLPLAESSGLVVDLDWWVLREACAQLFRWQAHYPFASSLSVSVNLSSQQFSQPNLLKRVEETLQATQLDPRNLKLEITEGAIGPDAGSVTERLAQLRQMQVQLSLDDFGTGYSSLARLQDFPVDVLKIDRSFTQRLGTNKGSDEIVGTIIELAHRIGMQVVAEGVETSQQLEILRSLHCEYIQGYFCYKPLPAEQLENLFSTHPSIFISQSDLLKTA